VRALVRVARACSPAGRQPALKEFGLNTLLAAAPSITRRDQIAQIIDRRFLEFSFDVNDHDAFTFRGAMGPTTSRPSSG